MGCSAAGALTGGTRRGLPAWSSGIPSWFSSTLEYWKSRTFCSGLDSPVIMGNGFKAPLVWKPKFLPAPDVPVSYSACKKTNKEPDKQFSL